jgi:hypothetical protein
MGAKVVLRNNTLLFECPASICGTVRVPLQGEPHWNWNGSLDAPTLTPSVRITWDWGEPPNHVHNCCHFNITDGSIQFHGDCTHELKGKTIAMADVTEEFNNYFV